MTSFAFIVGVIPLAVAAGAGAEMRRSLGIAVFNGMLGVTIFGIFLTPVFFSVIMGLSETRLFTAAATRWAGSTLLSGMVGLMIGFLLAELGVTRLPWALGICGAAGVIAAPAVLIIHRFLGAGSLASREDPSLTPSPDVPPNGEAWSDAYGEDGVDSFPPSPGVPHGEGHH
jgi:multidrug efflux pump